MTSQYIERSDRLPKLPAQQTVAGHLNVQSERNILDKFVKRKLTLQDGTSPDNIRRSSSIVFCG
jgi:hypothetical protein